LQNFFDEIPGGSMARMIPAADRVKKARALIQKAREIPVPEETGRFDIYYIAEVKKLLREARDLIKFISYTPTASDEMKADVKMIFEEADLADQELLRGKKD
jgi:ABC-type Na+ transport system ATPase subunit NatA